MLNCTFDFSDVADALKNFDDSVRQQLDKVGKEAVDYAVENGDYNDVTGRLRKSNRYEVEKDGLGLHNDAPYAADVEAQGKDVLGNAYLYAEKRLKEIFE